MTQAAMRILEEFASRYPSSAAASGGAPLRLSSARTFRDLERAGADEKESFLEAAEELARRGILEISWERRKEGEAVRSLTLRDPQGLFSLLGRSSPADTAQAAREAAANIAAAESAASNSAASTSTASKPLLPTVKQAFFEFLASSLDAKDADRGIDATLIRDLALLPLYNNETQALTTRALSVSLFADSKRIEALLAAAKPLFSRAAAAGIPAPEPGRLERSFPETLIAGACTIRLAGKAAPLENPSGAIIGIPAETAAAITAITGTQTGASGAPADAGAPQAAKPNCALGIENKETFHVLARALEQGRLPQFTLLVYVAGHPNRAVQLVFSALARSGWQLSHSGDLDPDGILILQELADAAGAPVVPWRMDSATFDRYCSHSRPLDGTMLVRAAAIRDDTRALPGIEGLLERILATGRGVEQEIINYCYQ